MKRIIFWIGFAVVVVLLVWGLIAASNHTPTITTTGTPAAVSDLDHIEGNVNASTTLIEYGDFQCPACGVYYPVVKAVMDQNSSSLRLVFRHFPLPQHANAIPAAIASEAASMQGKFWQMYDALYSNQSEWSEATSTASIFEKYAKNIGLDVTRFKVDSAATTTLAKINSDKAEGVSININHTPTFFLNGKEISPQSYNEFKTIIQTALKGSAK